MPELDAEHRDQLARAVHEAASRCVHPDYSDPQCEAWADALGPLVTGWLAGAWDEGYLLALRDVENIAADMNADNPYRDKLSKDGED